MPITPRRPRVVCFPPKLTSLDAVAEPGAELVACADLTELAADTPAAGGEDGRSLHVGGGKAAAAAEGGGAALQTLRRRARGGRAHEEAAAAAGAAPSSIRDEGRSFAIVTTASLPWMTGAHPPSSGREGSGRAERKSRSCETALSKTDLVDS